MKKPFLQSINALNTGHKLLRELGETKLPPTSLVVRNPVEIVKVQIINVQDYSVQCSV